MQIDSLKIPQCDFLYYSFTFCLSQLKCVFDKHYRPNSSLSRTTCTILKLTIIYYPTVSYLQIIGNAVMNCPFKSMNLHIFNKQVHISFSIVLNINILHKLNLFSMSEWNTWLHVWLNFCFCPNQYFIFTKRLVW